MRAEAGARCGSCGKPAEFTITLRGRPMPACLRHLNHWRTPPPDFTCPAACVESNHPGREHSDWLAEYDAPPSGGRT